MTSALALPSLARVPVAFAAGNAAGSDQLKACAIALADAGILRPEHMEQLYRHMRPSKPNQTLAATFKFESEPAAKHLIEIALEDVTRRNRPNPLVKLGVMVASDTSLFNQDGYDSLGNNDDDARDKGGLLVSCDCQNPLHLEIGPNIQRLEQRHPGLGQTVLYWLSNGLNATVRACDPCTALEWCSNNYWMGDQDESERVEQEIDEPYYEAQQKLLPEAQRKPFDRGAEIKALDIYTRAEFDQEFPRDICSGQPKLSRPQLLRLRSRTRQPLIRIIDATLDVMSQRVERHQPDTKNDLGLLAYASWFVCPYLLRWHRPDGEVVDANGQDSMGMFWDDYLNQEYQAGETNLTANSAFLWHQGSPTEIAHAFHRFAAWCRTLQAAENLLTSIHPGLHVHVYDPDTVSPANLGRQLFSAADLGCNKAQVLVNRVNCFFNLQWQAYPTKLTRNSGQCWDFLIGCVDSAVARQELDRCNFHYWLDLGNSAKFGQVVLGETSRPGKRSRAESVARSFSRNMSKNELAEHQEWLHWKDHRLPNILGVFPQLKRKRVKEDTAPSCSLAEALEKQDLFINQSVATFALQLLWQFIREGGLDIHGYFINLQTGKVTPLPIK